MARSVLRSNVCAVVLEPLREALRAQKKHAAYYDDKTVRVVGAKVPQWYRDALEAVIGAAPTFFGQPIEVGEHEEIAILFWNPTMSLDIGAPVLI